jgi:hypothetical protein
MYSITGNKITIFLIIAYIVNHSKSYIAAALGCVIEYWIEFYFFRQIKFNLIVFLIGIILTISGQVIYFICLYYCF